VGVGESGGGGNVGEARRVRWGRVYEGERNGEKCGRYEYE
jgi:hypothetical protein